MRPFIYVGILPPENNNSYIYQYQRSCASVRCRADRLNSRAGEFDQRGVRKFRFAIDGGAKQVGRFVRPRGHGAESGHNLRNTCSAGPCLLAKILMQAYVAASLAECLDTLNVLGDETLGE